VEPIKIHVSEWYRHNISGTRSTIRTKTEYKHYMSGCFIFIHTFIDTDQHL